MKCGECEEKITGEVAWADMKPYCSTCYIRSRWRRRELRAIEKREKEEEEKQYDITK